MGVVEAKLTVKKDEPSLPHPLPPTTTTKFMETMNEELARMKMEKKPTEAAGDQEMAAIADDAGPDQAPESPRKVEAKGDGPRFPQRPDEPDCAFYMKTGTCKFGMTCKFNHPPKRREQWAKLKKQSEDGQTVEEKRGEPGTKMMRQTTRKNAGGKQKGPLRQVEQTETKVVNKNHLPPRTEHKDNKKAIVTKVLKTGLNRPVFPIWIGLLRTRLWKRSSRTANRVVGEGQEGEGRRRRRRGRRRRRRRGEEEEEGGGGGGEEKKKERKVDMWRRVRVASSGRERQAVDKEAIVTKVLKTSLNRPVFPIWIGQRRTRLWKRSTGAADRIAGEGQEGEGRRRRRRRRRRRGEEEEEGEGGGEEKKKKERKAEWWRRVRVASSGRERQTADENGKEKQGSCGRLEQQGF